MQSGNLGREFRDRAAGERGGGFVQDGSWGLSGVLWGGGSWGERLTSVDGRWRLLPCSELVLSMLIWSTSFRPFQSTAITSFPEAARRVP